MVNQNINKSQYRQQLSLLLYSIDIWPARNSRLTQRETNHYITNCASNLAWPYLAGSSPGLLVAHIYGCTASAICCMLSIGLQAWFKTNVKSFQNCSIILEVSFVMSESVQFCKNFPSTYIANFVKFK